jgi:uncharacterized delta-60 repeat protein
MRRFSLQLLESRRLLSAGDLDPTFSGDGYALVPALTASGEDADHLRACAEQPDGKLIVLAAGNTTIHLRRLNIDGSLDFTFGDGGDVATGLRTSSYASNVAIDPSSGRIALMGQQIGEALVSLVSVFTAEGAAQQTFGVGGTAALDLGITPKAIAFQPNGKLLIAGTTNRPDDGIIIKRLDSGGNLDSSFGDGGQIAINAGLESGRADFYTLRDLAVDRDGRIIVGADYQRSELDQDLFDALVFRFDRDGQPDASFDGDGVRTITGIGATPVQLIGVNAAQDGSIQALTRAYVAAKNGSTHRITRLAADGSFDASGYTGTLLLPRGLYVPRDFALDDAGRAMITGDATADGVTFPFAMRFAIDGQHDISYSYQGVYLGTTATLVDRALLLASDGKLIFGGTWVDPADASQLVLVRLDNGEGPLADFRLNPRGALIVDARNGKDEVSIFYRPSDGRLVARVNEAAESFPAELVTKVVVYLYDGDDILSIANGVSAAYVEGDDGNDIIAGSPGNDTLYGGFGDDRIYGNDGNDRLYGGQNEDYLIGGNGSDELYGERGIDTLSGGADDDLLFGGPQHADENYGGPGIDSASNDEKDLFVGVETLLDVLL